MTGIETSGISSGALLRVDKVCKRFGGLLALDRVSFTAEEGRITALIGPNGAGKTTLFAIISGFVRPSEGSVFYTGADITSEPPHVRARRGIARTFQLVQPFAELTVHDNITVGAYLQLDRRGRTHWRLRPTSRGWSGSATCCIGFPVP